MCSSALFLSPSEAASRLGISVKALRLYERHGLISPVRTISGWRTYGPGEMSRAAEIVSLRALGFSLARIGRVLDGDCEGLKSALAAHDAVLDARLRELVAMREKLGALRDELAQGKVPEASELVRAMSPELGGSVAFDLPWPWAVSASS